MSTEHTKDTVNTAIQIIQCKQKMERIVDTRGTEDAEYAKDTVDTKK